MKKMVSKFILAAEVSLALVFTSLTSCGKYNPPAQYTTVDAPAYQSVQEEPSTPQKVANQSFQDGVEDYKNAPVAKTVAADDELDIAIRDASDYLNDNIPKGSKIVILNIESVSGNLSEYIIDELIANAVNDKTFSVVDRRQLEAIKAEQKFQLSGVVDDKDALAIGKFFGAQTIISGTMRDIGGRYRLTIRALAVQTAQVQGQYNRNMAISKTLVGLANSGGTASGAYSGTASNTITATSNQTTQATPATVSASVAPAGSITVNNVSTWNTAINQIRNGGNDKTYIINVTGNISVPVPPSNENLFGSVIGVTVTIQGSGTLSMSNATGSLIQIGARQTVIVRDVTLRGHSDNKMSLIRIMSDGIFRMEGSASVTGNTDNALGFGSSYGSGVCVNGGTFILQDRASVTDNANPNHGGGIAVIKGGTFIMEGGTVTSNTSIGSGGGVAIMGGNFTMRGGTISGNATGDLRAATGKRVKKRISGSRSGGGGGVYFSGGSFNMEGGMISGNTSSGDGGGVYIAEGKFTKTGGTISGNDAGQSLRNTARGKGHGIISGKNWRNATAGPDDRTDGFGFWLND